jgi:MFS family permease
LLNAAEKPRTEEVRPRLVTPIFLLITISTFAYFLSIGAVIPTLPRYVEGPMGGGSISVGIAIGAFAFSAVLLRPFIGGVGDRRGRRLIIVGGALTVALSIAAYTFASSLFVLILLRLVMGAGEAAFYVGAASAINDLAPDARRGEALSIFSLALYAGIALGTVLGETVLDARDFTSVWIFAASAAVVAGLLAVRVPDTRPETAAGNPSPRRLVHPSGLKPGVILATSIWGLAGFNTFVPLYALSIGMSGSRFAFLIFSGIVLGIRSFGARLPDILGPRTATRWALIANTVGLVIIGLWAQPAGLYIGAVVFGIGQALAFPALMTIALRGAPPAERGAVVGTFTAFFDLAFGVGALSLGIVADLIGYRGLFISAAGVSLIGLGLMQGYVVRARRAEAEDIPDARRPEPV